MAPRRHGREAACNTSSLAGLPCRSAAKLGTGAPGAVPTGCCAACDGGEGTVSVRLLAREVTATASTPITAGCPGAYLHQDRVGVLVGRLDGARGRRARPGAHRRRRQPGADRPLLRERTADAVRPASRARRSRSCRAWLLLSGGTPQDQEQT